MILWFLFLILFLSCNFLFSIVYICNNLYYINTYTKLHQYSILYQNSVNAYQKDDITTFRSSTTEPPPPSLFNSLDKSYSEIFLSLGYGRSSSLPSLDSIEERGYELDNGNNSNNSNNNNGNNNNHDNDTHKSSLIPLRVVRDHFLSQLFKRVTEPINQMFPEMEGYTGEYVYIVECAVRCTVGLCLFFCLCLLFICFFLFFIILCY